MGKHPGVHFLADILDITSKAAQIKCGDFSNPEMFRLLKDQSAILPSAWCLQHRAICPLQGPDADGSGSPCQDFSRSGGLHGLSGKTVVCFVTWARFHTWWATKLIMHENVQGFPIWFARVHLSDFCIYPIDVHPGDAGFPLVERYRQYLLCVNRRTAELTYDIYALYNYVKAKLATDLTPKDAVFSGPTEIRQEERDICQVRRFPVRSFTLPQDLFYTLSFNERAYVDRLNTLYMLKFGKRPETDQDLVYNLADNPVDRTSWSATSGKIPTLRRNSNRLYFPFHRRCLTRTERLALMGYPSHRALADACGSVEVTSMTGSEQAFLLGNAMHMPCATMIFTIGCACVKAKPL